MEFDRAFEILVGPQHEGGYSNNPADPGGETMYGVTAAVARANGYTGPMRDLPLATAKTIYRARYWTPAGCDQLPELLRFELFDLAVNAGPVTAIKLLQRAVGADEDGVLGPNTARSLALTDPQMLLRRLQAQRIKYYTSLKTFQAFGRGWMNRVADNMLGV